VAPLQTVEEALASVLERVVPLASERVQLGAVAGRVLAAPAVARVDLPPFPSSAMDGFAVLASDTPGMLPIGARIAAGAPASAPLAAGTAAEISTGAAVPDGANAVVPIEEVVETDGHVEIRAAAEPGAHVRPRGGDVAAGTVVVESGARLGAWHIGALGAAGVPELECAVRPRVVVLATGSELRQPGDELGPGQIFESNRALLEALFESAGAEVELLPIVPDELEAHRGALVRGLEADVLVTTGGVSVGPHDLVRGLEADLGVEEVFWGVAVKPGKPLSFGVRERTLVFGLPGNPVSTLVGALLFVAPALLALQGATDPGPTYQAARCARPLKRNAHRDEFLRARRRWEENGVVVEPVVGQESHMIVRAAAADALVHVPRGADEIPAGAPVRYLALA
jgi:molybdopterin molybdotransferase